MLYRNSSLILTWYFCIELKIIPRVVKCHVILTSCIDYTEQRNRNQKKIFRTFHHFVVVLFKTKTKKNKSYHRHANMENIVIAHIIFRLLRVPASSKNSHAFVTIVNRISWTKNHLYKIQICTLRLYTLHSESTIIVKHDNRFILPFDKLDLRKAFSTSYNYDINLDFTV